MVEIKHSCCLSQRNYTAAYPNDKGTSIPNSEKDMTEL